MTNLFIDISEKIDKDHIEVIAAIKEAADSMNISFFIIGASARDYIFEHFYGIRCLRKTNDIDIGISVSTWDRFEKLKKILLNEKEFSKTKLKQRLRYRHNLIDIVPFGDIAAPDYRISWPPENEIIMTTLGFEEAYQNSLTVRLGKNLEVRIPLIPGLTALKLISWEDNYPDRKRDAEDIMFIMNNYENAGNFDRLYGQEKELLEDETFDNTLASIRLLGKDMSMILKKDAKEKIRNILAEETSDVSQYSLVRNMMHSKDDFENTLLKLGKLITGFNGES